MAVKAVLFDLDNTLLDFLDMKKKCVSAAVKSMRENGLKMSEKSAFESIMKMYGRRHFEDHTIFQRFIRKHLKKIDYLLLGSAISAYRQARYSVLKPYSNVPFVLGFLKKRGIRLGVVSDAPKLKAWIRLCSTNLQGYFDFVITLGDTKAKKPSPAPFKRAVKELKLKPDEIIFVGDNPARDILGAKRAGMKTCLAEYGQVFMKRVKSDFIMRDIGELIEIIQKQGNK